MSLTEKALEFLYENRCNNSREWYEEHKSEYREYVTAPLTGLVNSLAGAMLEIDSSLLVEPRYCVSRVRRDTRFTHDKSLYRDNAWITFMPPKKDYESLPGFFFEFGGYGWRYGCGYYSAGTRSMEAMRRMIIAGDAVFLAAKEAFEEQSEFVMEGETYKRKRYPDMPEDISLWLERRNLDFTHNSTDFETLYSDSLAERLEKGFRALAPVFAFMMKAERLKDEESVI